MKWYAKAAADAEGHDHRVARTEELYHRLMLRQGADELGGFAVDEVDPGSIERAWEDPLPLRAKAWLACYLSRSSTEADAQVDWDESSVAVWEASAVARAEEHLYLGKTKAALKVLREREDRSEASPIYSVHVRALARLRRFDDAYDVADRGLTDLLARGHVEQALELAEEAARAALSEKR